jgi:hypothetical protein
MSTGPASSSNPRRTFRHRPLHVQADQWDGIPDPEKWGWAKCSGRWAIAEDAVTGEFAVRNEEHELWIKLNVGDWVIQGPDDQFIVVKDNVFRQSYERIEERAEAAQTEQM